MSYFTGFVLVVLVLYASRRLIFRAVLAAMKVLPGYREQMERLARSYEAEVSVVESAEWFGRSGLSDDDERELPKYLRREFGELLIDEGSLKASDLIYVGAFDESDGRVHYWSFPSSGTEPRYAYIAITAFGTCTGWGDRVPPVREAGPRDVV